MSQRKTRLVNSHFYHVFNRGINKIPIFYDFFDYQRALETIKYYRINTNQQRFSEFLKMPRKERDLYLSKDHPGKVEIVVFCLMPNHFHFILKQLTENGISDFVSRFSNSYTKYFNIKYNRCGHLFQDTFKSVFIEDDEQLIHLSRYIHFNPVTSFIVGDSQVAEYKWSSARQYLGMEEGFVCTETVMQQFKNIDAYKKFLDSQVDYAKKLEAIKHLTID